MSVAYGDYLPPKGSVTEWKKPAGASKDNPCLQVRRILNGDITMALSTEPAFTVRSSAQQFARFVQAVRDGDFDEFIA